MGTAYFFERRLGESERYYRLAVTLEPRNPIWRTNLGDLYVRTGQADSARAAYVDAVRLTEDLLRVDPNNVVLRLDRAVALAKSGDCPGARAALGRISATLPADDAESAHKVARLAAVCGERTQTLAALRQAVRLGVPARLLIAEDEFHFLAGDPEFLALTKPPAK